MIIQAPDTTTFIWLAGAFGAAFALALLVTPLVIRSAALLNLYDSPDQGRRLHREPVPRLGGIAVFLVAAAVGSLLFMEAHSRFTASGPEGAADLRFLTGAFVGSAFLFLVGFVDDLRSLPPGVKFVAEIAAALIAWYFGARLSAVALGYGPGVSTGWLALPLTLFWIVGVTNVFNFIDGLDGLASGIAVVACGTIVVAALALGNTSVLLPAMVLAGGLVGFLKYNFPRARIFLGDAGSLSVGFLLAVLSMQAAVNDSGSVLILVPVVALAVPIMDGSLAILRRFLRHVPISGADARHIHHRLLALGISPRNTAVLLWGLATVLAGLGLLISLTAPYVATSFAILGVVGVAVMMIYGTNLLAYHELTVAGEVIASAPARIRRVISDQILAVDVASQIAEAVDIEALSELLVAVAPRFGFLSMDLTSETQPRGDVIHPVNWAWKLDYPVRIGIGAERPQYVLSIWCSPDFSTRPYGAERIARIVGPAIVLWFEQREVPTEVRKTPPSRRRSLIIGRRRTT